MLRRIARSRLDCVYRPPYGFAGTERRYTSIARSSSSVICALLRHGITALIGAPPGRLPSRSARIKAASLQVLIHPLGVILEAGGHSGGVPGMRPPERLGPWQLMQPLVAARYCPYATVTPAGTGPGIGRV